MSDTIIVAIIGVAGTIIGTVIGLFSNVLIEKKRAKNDGRIHVSKTQFDLQIEIYKQLSSAFFRVLVKLNTLEAIKEGRHLHKDKLLTPNDYKILVDVTAKAQDILYENAPFIPEDIYEKYDNVNNLINNHFWKYIDNSPFVSQTDVDVGSNNNIEDITGVVEHMLREINACIRARIADVSIIE